MAGTDPPFPAVGDMPMPTGFRYKKIYERGKPQHEKTDAFRLRHPSMAVSKRAKIFAPFDALKGFNDAVSAKNELYESRRELSEEDLAELNSRMTALLRLVSGGKRTERKQVQVTVTYFVPCTDINNEAYGVKGQYHTVTGTCVKIDPDRSRSILVDDRRIRFRDIFELKICET